MRTTEAARYARTSVAIAAVLAIVVAGVYASRMWQARQSEQAAPPAVPPTVQQRSSEFTFSKVEGDQTRFTVRASRATEFKEGGRSLLEDVWVTAFGSTGGRADDLRTAACEYFAPAGKMECGGEVLMDLQGIAEEQPAPAAVAAGVSAGGIQVRTSKLAFDHTTGVASSAQPVEFSFPQGQGKAVGLRYDSERGELRLLGEVELLLRPQEESHATADQPGAVPPVTVSSREMLFRKGERLLRFFGAARARQGRQELEAGEITVELNSELRADRLVARDSPKFHGASGESPIVITADELSAPLGASGQPQRIVAAGKVQVDVSQAARRHRLEAASSQLELIEETGQPRRLTANGDVVASSSLPDGSTRRLQAPALEVYFAPPGSGRSQVERASAPSSVLDWQVPARTGSARQEAEHMRLAGRQLDGTFDVSGELRELRGSGGVEVQRSVGSGPPARSTSRELLAIIGPDGLWSRVDQSGDVHLTDAGSDARGDSARFDRQSDSVVLTGSVVLTDASSRTRAQSATFRQAAKELRAEGQVVTSELPAKTPSIGAPFEPAHISSDHLVVDTARSRAVYSGKARLWRADSLVQADTIELDRPANVMTATGNVRAVFPEVPKAASSSPSGTSRARSQRQFWQAQAGKMTYEGAERRSRLERGARLESSEGAIRAERMDLFFAAPGSAASSSQDAASATRLGGGIGQQQLERGTGFGAVQVDSGGRTATGERADYTAAEGKFVLSGGKPKLHDSLGNATTGRQLTFFLADDRIVIDSEEGSRTLTLHRVEK